MESRIITVTLNLFASLSLCLGVAACDRLGGEEGEHEGEESDRPSPDVLAAPAEPPPGSPPGGMRPRAASVAGALGIHPVNAPSGAEHPPDALPASSTAALSSAGVRKTTSAISADGRGARSAEVVLANRTEDQLAFASGSASHGVWSTPVPSFIGAHTFARWQTDSNGFATGTEARIRYLLPAGPVDLHWDNPFVGSNSADGTAPAGFVVDRVGGEQNRSTTFFHLRGASTPATTCPWEVASWIIDNMIAGDEVGDGLNWLGQAAGFFTTPLFKETDISGGWGSTGCRTNDGEGIVLHDGQHSTDGYYTIDVALTHTWGMDFPAPGPGTKFVRLEVRPGTDAHATIDQFGEPQQGMRIFFQGPFLLDHGAFIEDHPDAALQYFF